tara:strand:- start:897 stop:1871 length:975 start_codon:yes stop_codon:yes gene_type:complete
VSRNNRKNQRSERLDEARKRAKSRFGQTPVPLGFPSNLDSKPTEISIKWPTNPIRVNVERKMCDLVTIPGEWGFLDDDNVGKIAKRLEPHKVTVDQGLSLRKALMQEKAVYGHHKMMARANMLRRRYDNGESVLQLSKRFDFPPVAIFRAILTSRGWSKVRIRDALRQPEKKMPGRDATEFKDAEEKDRVTNVNQGETAIKADLFEVVVGNYLDHHGINYRRQEDLLKEQQKEHGRPVNTPDFLILDHLEINGEPVAWIDAKNFYGANLSFTKRKTKKQMNRYIDEWGSGAIVYRHSFCDGLTIPGVLMLDQSPLDTSIMNSDE